MTPDEIRTFVKANAGNPTVLARFMQQNGLGVNDLAAAGGYRPEQMQAYLQRANPMQRPPMAGPARPPLPTQAAPQAQANAFGANAGGGAPPMPSAPATPAAPSIAAAPPPPATPKPPSVAALPPAPQPLTPTTPTSPMTATSRPPTEKPVTMPDDEAQFQAGFNANRA